MNVMHQMRAKIAAGAERDREFYAQRAALAEEGQELAREERKRLQVCACEEGELTASGLVFIYLL